MTAALELTREQILGHRRRTGALDARLPWSAESLSRAAWAGLQDSMPRAALLSIHARVAGTGPDVLDEPSLTQVWGPRYSAFVVAEEDAALFTLGRYPDDARGRHVADATAERLAAVLDGRRLKDREAVRSMAGHPWHIRYSTTTGTVRIRWEGALAPYVWTVPRPAIEPLEARLELARRYLTVLGPGTAPGLAIWAGIGAKEARAAFDALASTLVAVRTPVGEGWILAADEPSFRAAPGPPAPARLLPSGDPFWLYWGADRELLVQDPRRRGELWTSRVWPGALLVDGEIAGVWRRSNADLAIDAWRKLSAAERTAVEAEAAALPLPGLRGEIRVRWG
jgi:winged helix DNA-binding protein